MKHRAFTFFEAIVVLVVFSVAAVILYPVFFVARETGPRGPTCPSNLKLMGLGFMQYIQDYDEKTPPASNAVGGWAKLIFPYTKSEQIFQCPQTQGFTFGSTDYFFNRRLAGVARILGYDPRAARAVTILSGDGDNNQKASYNLNQLPAAWLTNANSPAQRHNGSANYLFIDGHVQSLSADKITLQNPALNQPTFRVK